MSEIETVQGKTVSETFSDSIGEISKDKELQREIDNYLYVTHRIPRGTFIELMVNNEKFDELDSEEQAVVVNAIYVATKNEEFNPEQFYNQRQLSRVKKYKRPSEEVITLPYTFGNYVIRSTESDFITSLKIKEIAQLWENKILEYNPNIQRKQKEKLNKKTGEFEKSIKVIHKSVVEITDLMKRNRFRSNTITFCILMDGTESIAYDDGELTLESGHMYIIDGYHRLSAILNVLEVDPDNELSMDVSIKYLSYDDARHYLGQINKMSKFDKSFTSYLMNDKIEDKIANEIEAKSILNGRITTESNVAKKKTYLTSHNVLATWIREIFAPKDSKDRIDIAEVLINFFDYLIASYPKDFSKDLPTLIEARDNSLRNYHNTFVVYLVIAKALYDKYGKRIPSDEIIRLVELFDYSKTGEYANVLFREGTGKVNSNQVKKEVKEYAEKKVNENLE